MKPYHLIRVAISLAACVGCTPATVVNQEQRQMDQRANRRSSVSTNAFVSDRLFQDYIPVSPVDFDQPIMVFDPKDKQSKPMSIMELSLDAARLRAFLTNQTGYTAVQKLDDSGELKFGPATITAEAGSYNVYFDYCKFTTLRVTNGDNNCPGFAKVGVGFRIIARIRTFEAGVDVSSLLALGVSAKLAKLTGELSVEVIGIDSPKVTDLMTLPVDISQASIQNAIQSMAAIKSKIWDADVMLSPKVIAIKKTPGCSLVNLFNNADPTKRFRTIN